MSDTGSGTPPADPVDAARARDEVENQANVLYLAALAYIATHGEDEDPDDDSAVGRAAKTLALKLLRSVRRQFATPPKGLRGEARQEWVREQARTITQQAVAESRAHYSTVAKREKKRDPAVSDRAIMAAVADDRPWAAAAARTTATQRAAETALDMLPDVEKVTGEPHSKLWISRGDPKVRKLHRKLHGKVRTLGSAFEEWPSGQSLSYPGDPKAPLDATINCRCALFLVPTKDAKAAEATFEVDDEDFDVPLTAAAAQVRSWERERARREWFLELGLRRS